MTTRNIVPRANGEGSIGTSSKKWGALHVNQISFDTLASVNTTWSATTGRRTSPLINSTEIATGGISSANLASGIVTQVKLVPRTIVSLADASSTLTAAQLVAHPIFTITAIGPRDLTTATATSIVAAATGYTIGSCYEFNIINLGSIDITLVAGTGITIIGNSIIFGSYDYDGEYPATFVLRIDSVASCSIYRIS